MNASSGDSFFTAINEFDRQVGNFRAEPCEELIEATTRRLVELRGPIYAATRLQRVADICAGVYVLPIEHWNTKPIPEPEREVQSKAPSRPLARAAFWSAFGLGWLGATAFNIVLRLTL